MQSLSALKIFVLFLSFRGSFCEEDYSKDGPKCYCDDDYHYDGLLGPHVWASLYPDCGEPNQSPINLDINSIGTRSAPSYQLVTPGSNGSYLVNITNDGHTAVLRLVMEDGMKPPYIGEFPYESYEYALDHIKFHWGPNSSVGSEHTVNGHRYPLELQAVFYNQYECKLSNALGEWGGVVVISRFSELREYENTAWDDLKPTLQQVEEAGASAVSTNRVNLMALIPRKMSHFIWYEEGTMTSPPCQGLVSWIVDAFIIGSISNEQLDVFRRLKDRSGQPVRNVRPLQPVGKRSILDHVVATNPY